MFLPQEILASHRKPKLEKHPLSVYDLEIRVRVKKGEGVLYLTERASSYAVSGSNLGLVIEYFGFFLQRPLQSFQATSGVNRGLGHCLCQFHFFVRETSYIRRCANCHKANSYEGLSRMELLGNVKT